MLPRDFIPAVEAEIARDSANWRKWIESGGVLPDGMLCVCRLELNE